MTVDSSGIFVYVANINHLGSGNVSAYTINASTELRIDGASFVARSRHPHSVTAGAINVDGMLSFIFPSYVCKRTERRAIGGG